MKFAKYYDVTNIMNQLIDENKLTSYQKEEFEKLYICNDTHDFWVVRVIEGYNSAYEKEDGMYLIERNKINKYDFCKFINDEVNITNKFERENFIDALNLDFIIRNVLIMDDELGLENWDNIECDSLEEVIDVIDGGYGIMEVLM